MEKKNKSAKIDDKKETEENNQEESEYYDDDEIEVVVVNLGKGNRITIPDQLLGAIKFYEEMDGPSAAHLLIAKSNGKIELHPIEIFNENNEHVLNTEDSYNSNDIIKIVNIKDKRLIIPKSIINSVKKGKIIGYKIKFDKDYRVIRFYPIIIKYEKKNTKN